MKKQVSGKQFKRDSDERKALFLNLASSLVLHERIRTTEEKAKAIKGNVEKLVTRAIKKDEVMAIRLISAHLTSDAVKKMIEDIAPRFVGRNGGYLRIIKDKNRFNDNASMVYLEWVEKASLIKPAAPVTEKTKKTEKVNATLPIKTKNTTPKKETVKKIVKTPAKAKKAVKKDK